MMILWVLGHQIVLEEMINQRKNTITKKHMTIILMTLCVKKCNSNIPAMETPLHRPIIVMVTALKDLDKTSDMSQLLTHWSLVMHICVSKLTIIASDNGLWPGRRQAIIWTNAGILLIRTLGTNFSEMLSEIHPFYSRKCHLQNGGKCVSASMC